MLFAVSLLFSKECADQYNDEAFLDAPSRLGDIVDEGLKGLPLFGNAKAYKKLGFKKINIDEENWYIKPGSYVKEKDYIYPTPVQGDINFLVNTAFIIRRELKPIKNWKRALNNIDALKALFEQDKLPGFKQFVNNFM